MMMVFILSKGLKYGGNLFGSRCILSECFCWNWEMKGISIYIVDVMVMEICIVIVVEMSLGEDVKSYMK